MAGERHLPVLFVPGVITPARLSYGNLLAELGDEVDPVLKELEVYANDSPPDNYGLDMEVEGIKRAADESGLTTFHLVGYSGGGGSSLAFAARYPDRLRSLAMIEPAWIGNDGWTSDEVAFWQEIDRIADLPPAERIRGFARLNAGSGKAPPPSGPEPDWMAKRPAGIDAITRAFREYELDVKQLRHFERPVYIAVGGLSHPSELRKAERLSALLPDVQVEVYQDRHHMDPPHRAEAGRFARALRELWERAEGRLLRRPS